MDSLIDRPLQNEDFVDIASFLFCIACLKGFERLETSICSFLPNIDEKIQEKQIFSLLSFYYRFRKTGPLPQIHTYSFLTKLHDHIEQVILKNSDVTHTLKFDELIKMIFGIRFLIAKSMCIEHQFLCKEISFYMTNYLPTEPAEQKNAWDRIKKLLKLSEPSKEIEMISSLNYTLTKHLR